jgi:hypothetical protein
VNGDDPTPPAAADDFPEFSEPPRLRPSPEALEPRASEPEPDDTQSQVDDVIARLRRERDEGRR